MNKKNTHIDWRIFRKAASGKLNVEDQSNLETWLKRNANNKRYFEKAVQYYKRIEREEEREIDYAPAFDRFMKVAKSKRSNTLRMVQVAASVILLLACGWLAYIVSNSQDFSAISDAMLIQAKEGEVELVLSSGEKILLRKEGESNIKEKDGEIKKKDGQVDYLAFDKTSKKITQYNTVNVPRGTDFKLVLSDSTVVWLNAESSITYPVKFAGNIRKVSITGEACFDVTPNKNKPFIVETYGTQVKVLGTEFNINAYEKANGIYTTLIEGSVAVKNEFGRQIVIQPNEQAITSSSADVVVKTIDVNRVIDWRRGVFDFEDEPLGDILEELARWYDFKIFYESEELKTFEFTGGIDRYEDVNQLLKLFEMTKSVNFYIKGNVLLVKKAE